MLNARLSRFDYFSLALLLSVFAVGGAVVELRSAFLKHRHTDLGPPLRAGWALRERVNPYTVTDDGGLHYVYPLPYALLMTPFADAPPGAPQPEWAVPYPVTVALWYLASVALLFWTVHHLCRFLEETRPGGADHPPPGSRRFWWVRSWPIWICLPSIGSSLSRGQVNLLLLALLAGFITSTARGRRASAGWWLAAATCLKVIPALLILDPLLRRDWRTLKHYALGLVAGLVVLPALTVGPDRAWDATRTFVTWTILPGLTNEPGPLSHELTGVSSSDNQSIRTVVHSALNWSAVPRPAKAALGTSLAHVLISAALVAWTFRAARRIADERYRTLFRLGGLGLLLTAVSPMSHTHYMVWALPVVLGLVYREMELRRSFRWRTALVLVVVVHVATNVWPRIPFLPGYQAARDLGVAMFGTLAVWWAGLSLPALSAAPAESTGPSRLPLFLRFGRLSK